MPDPAAAGPEHLPAATPSGILPVRRVGALLEILLCSGFPTQLALLALLSAMGLSLRTESGQFSPAFIFALSLLDAVLVIALVLVFLTAHRESPRAVLLGQRRAAGEVVLGLLLLPLAFFLVLVLLAVVLTWFPELHNVPRNPLEDMLQNRRDSIIFGVVVMVAGGVREEVQRGFILHRFERYLGGGLVGLVVFSAVFGLGHVDQGIDVAIATGLLGALWGTVYLVRRSIVAPMVSHAGFNLAQLVKYVALR
jgi:membrane protease YdiL (CAAX protease family)